MTDSVDPYRLPSIARPSRYDIVLAPDLATSTFRGQVAVRIDLDAATDRVVCNAAELEIVSVWLQTADGRVEATATVDEDLEQLTVELASRVAPGTATLHVDFRGVLNDKLRGFYRSTYTDGDGATHAVAVTQFEATDARRAFPCWDEPSYKAVFGVTLDVAEDLLAISNGPELSRTPTGDGRVRIAFADTMPMSTYLVAFVVGPLETTGPVDVDGIPLRIVHPPGKRELARFALDVGAFALSWFAGYYGIAYPGDKMDMVAVPDFAFGAMENLGCVIYRETLLLVDPETATQSELLAVVDVIAHELAHMWFGDLVTMEWWNGIWLNEAFATFMEMKCSEAFRPEWERWMHFGRERSGAFDVDALESTRPIEFPVHSPADAEAMFDVLTYQKGSAVVRMLEQYLGEDAFRDGIRRYLQSHQFGNTDTGDLWDALEAETGEPVRTMMESWIFQGGFPLVAATRTDDMLTLRQEPFRYLGHGDSDSTWSIPIVVRHGEHEQRIVLSDRQSAVHAPGSPVVVNAGGHAFYRVDYDRRLADAIVEGLAGLSPLERYAVLDDTVALTLRGDRRGSELAALIGTIADIGELDLSIWQLTTASLDMLRRALHTTDREAFAAWTRATLRPVLDTLGTDVADTDDDRRRAVRGLVFSTVAINGDIEMAALADELFATALDKPGGVDAELGSGALAAVAVHAGAAQFDAMLDRFRHGATPQEQLRYLYAAANVADPGLFDRYLALLDTGEVRSQNLAFAYRAALRNILHGPRAWAVVRERWDRIRERLPFNAVPRLVEGITAIADGDTADDIATFLLHQDLPEAGKLIAQHIERMEVQVALRAREADRLVAELT